MPTFLFWNINGKPLAERVARIVAAHAVDAVMLAECKSRDKVVLDALDAHSGNGWNKISRRGKRLSIFSRMHAANWRLRHDAPSWLIYELQRPGSKSLLLVAAHLRCQLHGRDEDHLLETDRLASDLDEFEQELGFRRTLIVGDINVNPFHLAVVASNGLHAVMDLATAKRETREVQRTPSNRFFYNPMWGLFGDRTPGPSGTYYISSDGVRSYFWEMLDQVLLRPDLCDGFSGLKVLESDSIDSLLTINGIPDVAKGSDHLPLLFSLEW